MGKLTLGIVIGAVLSLFVLSFVGKSVMAEQGRIQLQDGNSSWNPNLLIYCDSANGNLVYISIFGGGVAMWGQPSGCAKTLK